MSNILVSPDFIVRTVGPNVLSVSNSDSKEFIKVENTWKYRHHKNILQFLVEQLHMEYKVGYAILYYTLRCSYNHISSIIWIPNECNKVNELTVPNRVKLWNNYLSILNERHQVLIDKILASDGAIVITKEGQVLYESVFADMKLSNVSKAKLTGAGETAAQILAKNGVAIKISQDGAIKFFSGNEKICY